MTEVQTTSELERNASQPVRHVHWTVQRKGGIGKSFVAKILTEYFNADAYDLDFLNQTLAASHEHLNVNLVNVTIGLTDFEKGTADSGHTAGALSTSGMDTLIDHIIGKTDAKHCVIDCGSPIYEPILDYFTAVDIVRLFAEVRIQTWFHLIVCGGQHQDTTASDAVMLLNRFCPAGAKAVIWENDYQGKVIGDDPDDTEEKIGVQNLRAWPAIRAHTRSLVSLRRRSGLDASDIQTLVMRPHRTFATAIQDASTSLPARSRLQRIWSNYEQALDAIFAPKSRQRTSLDSDAVRRVAEHRQRSTQQKEQDMTDPDENEELHAPPEDLTEFQGDEEDTPYDFDEDIDDSDDSLLEDDSDDELTEEEYDAIMGGDD